MMCLIELALIFIIGYLVWNNDDGKQREIRIVQEYQSIKHSEGAKLVYYELNRKIIKRWIRSELKIEETSLNVQTISIGVS